MILFFFFFFFSSRRRHTRLTCDWSSDVCSSDLFEILEVAGRAELKSDLLQELERQKQILLGFRNNPQIAEGVLREVISDIERSSAALFAMTGKIGQYLRENDWLMSIKQRSGIPGGVCEFDLPSYHFWLHREGARRGADL